LHVTARHSKQTNFHEAARARASTKLVFAKPRVLSFQQRQSGVHGRTARRVSSSTKREHAIRPKSGDAMVPFSPRLNRAGFHEAL
jgi:hypothetical protein